MNLVNQVIIAKDVKVFPIRGEWTESEDQASVRGHITPNNPYQNRVKNKIESYKDIYDGDMFKFVDFTDAYAAMSRMGEFGDGQKAVIHLEDKNGAYRDMLFPSMRVIGEQGESEHFDRMVRKHWMEINSIWRLLKRREKDFHDFVEDKAAYYSRCWYFLYKDLEIEYAMHSGIHYDPDKEHVYVELEFWDDDVKDMWELIVRLPEGEISEVTVTNPKEFDLKTLKTETVAETLQRLRRDSDVIFEMARTGADPNHTEEDMNALRDKIDGRIIRKLVDFCPYCHENLLDERAYFVVRVPVQFFMHSGNFGICEDEVYQKVTEAVQAGKVTGKCGHCGHELTSEDINKTKDGWRWRYRRQRT